jgi:hypothetical protein
VLLVYEAAGKIVMGKGRGQEVDLRRGVWARR